MVTISLLLGLHLLHLRVSACCSFSFNFPCFSFNCNFCTGFVCDHCCFLLPLLHIRIHLQVPFRHCFLKVLYRVLTPWLLHLFCGMLSCQRHAQWLGCRGPRLLTMFRAPYLFQWLGFQVTVSLHVLCLGVPWVKARAGPSWSLIVHCWLPSRFGWFCFTAFPWVS